MDSKLSGRSTSKIIMTVGYEKIFSYTMTTNVIKLPQAKQWWEMTANDQLQPPCPTSRSMYR